MIHDVLQQNNSKAVYIAVVLEMTGFYVPELHNSWFPLFIEGIIKMTNVNLLLVEKALTIYQMCEGDEKWYLLQL